ncbi:MAG: sigma 54-interacting transcriptional regulator [Deltaproteobacteria bacterium]|nr:sigma 54-interacting transcriptional regulator [Deltaproteobacteria bacterium]
MERVEGEAKTRRYPRVPFHTHVDVSGNSLNIAGFTSNISRDGLAFSLPLKDLGEKAGRLPVGTELALRLHLPTLQAPLIIKCQVAWTGQPARDSAGRLAVRMGVHFCSEQPSVDQAVVELMASFRHRIAIIDFPVIEKIKETLDDLYPIEEIKDLETLNTSMSRSEVGLIVIGNGKGDDVLIKTVIEILRYTQVEIQPPLLVCVPEDSKAFSQLPPDKFNVLFARWPISALELRALAVRSVESHAVALENARLRFELEGMVERLQRENQFFRGKFVTGSRFEGIIGDSAPMRRLYETVERVAASDANAIILGETGTGKELIARALFLHSRRADKPFLAQNCAALSESLLDSELFGHCRGAFTGAVLDHAGLFEAADGGTIFLDEVAEMSQTMQAKLLRVLQNKELRRIGETKIRQIDVRVICATHRNLETMIADGRFRADLYYRIAVISLHIPPLRERRDDILALATHFLAHFAAENGTEPVMVSAEAMRLLEAYSWKGNVRELQHSMEKLAMLTPKGARITAESVADILGREKLSSQQIEDLQETMPLDAALEDCEKRLIERALRINQGVIAKAARTLGVNRSTLSKRCRRLGIQATE